MRYNFLFIIILFIILYACNSKTVTKDKEITLKNNFNDTCIIFRNSRGDTLKFNRTITIINNSFKDTLNIGFAKLKPMEAKSVFISQLDTSRSHAIYKENTCETDSPVNFTNLLCIYHLSKDWIQKDTTQKLIIKVKMSE